MSRILGNDQTPDFTSKSESEMYLFDPYKKCIQPVHGPGSANLACRASAGRSSIRH